jgi:hypothetical protein
VNFQPSRPSLPASARGLQDVGRDARDVRRLGLDVGEGVGRVEHVVLEARREGRELLLQLLEAGLLRVRELRAAEAEVAQFVADMPLARRRERGEGGGIRERAEAGEEPQVLALGGEVLGDPRQGRVVGLAQRGRVHHEVQVGHLRPGAPETLVGVVQGLDEVLPGGRLARGGQALHGGAALGEQVVDGRGDMLGTHVGEARQGGKIEKRVGHGDPLSLGVAGQAARRSR